MPDLSELDVDIDVSGELVRAWVDHAQPAIPSLLDVAVADQSGILAYRYSVPASTHDELIQRTAVGIMSGRLAQHPAKFKAWYSAALTDATLGKHQSSVERYVKTLLGDPAKPKDESHLYGLVGEFLLGQLLLAVDRGLGVARHLEQHDWAVTDPGGDCVVVYSTSDGNHFRLWESKAVTGTTKYPTAVVGEAADQLDLHAWEYLARWVTVAQHLDDPELAEFFVEMPDLWANGDPRAGAGISVSTHTAKPTNSCFAGLAGRFNLPDQNKQGTLILATDFKEFAEAVRAHIWKGAAWNAPSTSTP